MKPYFFYVRRDDRAAADLHIMMFEGDAEARDGDQPVGEVDRPGAQPHGL